MKQYNFFEKIYWGWKQVYYNFDEWICPDCGTKHDRDINAAKNILTVGTTVSACGDSVRPKVLDEPEATSMKQETTKSLVSW